MERLNLEQLARLVDEPPTPEERAVLEGSPGLNRELDALRSQTEALGDLPAVLPPPGGWHQLEQKLIAEGLILAPRNKVHPWRKWLQVAAALVIFIGGTAFGWVTGSAPTGPGNAPPAYASLDEWITAVDEATQQSRAVYTGFQQFVSSQGLERRSLDPTARLAALGTLIAATSAYVEDSPGDQFLNEILAASVAEHGHTVRQVVEDWR